MMKNGNGLPPYNNVVIRDRDGMLNMTDMWKAAGSPDGRAPADWRALESTKEFVAHIEAAFVAGKSGIETRKGGGGRGVGGGATWAHWQIGMAYAKYLSHEFHAWCNSVVRAHMEGKVLDSAQSGQPFHQRLGAVRTGTHLWGKEAGRQLWVEMNLPIVPGMRLPPPQRDLFKKSPEEGAEGEGDPEKGDESGSDGDA
ncbi:KilA-N domain-containing protein [Azospirillum argentinense]|uniref:KilA-N domain-containing protein n=1 Tax=Azospirillum argentinense TaxID=2970906 RepID=A0ABW8VEI5_9PROT